MKMMGNVDEDVDTKLHFDEDDGKMKMWYTVAEMMSFQFNSCLLRDKVESKKCTVYTFQCHVC